MPEAYTITITIDNLDFDPDGHLEFAGENSHWQTDCVFSTLREAETMASCLEEAAKEVYRPTESVKEIQKWQDDYETES